MLLCLSRKYCYGFKINHGKPLNHMLTHWLSWFSQKGGIAENKMTIFSSSSTNLAPYATHLSVLSLRHITHATRQFLEDQGMVPLILSSPVLMQRALNVSQPPLFSVDSKWYLNVGWEQTKVGRSFVQHGWWGKFKALFIPPTVAMQELLGGARLLCATAAVAGFAAA